MKRGRGWTTTTALCLLLATGMRGQQQPSQAIGSGAFRISGTVVEAGSGRPIKNVAVTIADSSHRERNATRVTGSDGQFLFDQIVAGKYTLSAQARGFIPQAFHETDGYSTAIAAGPGLDSEHIVFPLSAGGAISGSVVDQEGDAVRGAQILLFRQGISSGRSRIGNSDMQQTDSSGSFEFRHLRAGTYFVAVQAHPWYAQNTPRVGPKGEQINAAPSDLDVAYPITYYPGTDDSAAAAPIQVTDGSRTTIQMALRAVPALHVEITGVEPKPNKVVGSMLMANGLGDYPLLPGSTAIMSADNHRAEMTGVPPGRYELRVYMHPQNGGGAEPLGTKSVELTGDTTIDVSGISKASLSGQIVFADGARPSGPIHLYFMKRDGNRTGAALIGPDGNFSTNDWLSPGRYQINLLNAPGFYFKSISVKGASFADGELSIAEGASVQLSIVAVNGFTQVKGVVTKDEKPFAGALVLLIPQDRDRSDWLRRDQSDSDGTFTFNDVAPSRYTVLAIEDGHDLAYAEPAVIQPYLSQGQTVTIPAQGVSELKVEVVPRRPDAGLSAR